MLNAVAIDGVARPPSLHRFPRPHDGTPPQNGENIQFANSNFRFWSSLPKLVRLTFGKHLMFLGLGLSLTS